MNILIVGNGGRENIICKNISTNKNNKIYYYGNYRNSDMSQYATLVDKFSNDIDIAIIGPESYLSDGLVDKLSSMGIKCVGPTKKLAQIETSKGFARKLMTKYGLEKYCPQYKIFDKLDNIKEFLDELDNKYVIKADGLHQGKGVKVYGIDINNVEEALKYCQKILENEESVVIEERLIGEEFSLMSFTDGITLRHMPLVKDYKRLYDKDKGPNTGSMGSISFQNHSLPFLNEDDLETCHKINESIIENLYKETGERYKGIIYGSYIKTEKEEIKVIEFNARFGDPECINVLSILKNNLLDIYCAIIDEKLDNINVEFENKSTCCKYMVPDGYPENPVKSHEIYFDNDINKDMIIHGSLSSLDDKYYYEMGSRTVAIIGKANNLEDANKMVEKEIKKVHGPLQHRKDIGNNYFNKDKYKDAGVNIDEGNKVVKNIKEYVEMTFNDNVISKFGDFAGMYKMPNGNILISSTDGVGTKSILVLKQYGYEKGYEMLGHDLVNHCVNDILVKGAKPIFFLDYYANSKINAEHVKYFVKGISEACCKVGCVLIGGETAEMPDIYKEDRCDIAGTIIGVIEKEEEIINGKEMIKEGDLIIGLESSGAHTNGYSLIRKILETNEIPNEIVKKLCSPHKCYYDDIIKMKSEGIKINGMCHLTGGGWIDNPERVLPLGYKMDVKWEMNEEFKYLMKSGDIKYEEMIRTFNCGIGMLVYIDGTNIDINNFKWNIIGKVLPIQ